MKNELAKYQEIWGLPETRKEVLEKIWKDEKTASVFRSLPKELREEIIAFCMGNQGLSITYDPFFKYIFNPSLHPERLSELLSLLIGEEVEVVDVLPNESDRISEDGSLLITDILVKLKSGAYANVEIQKIGYAFPGQRCACYSSDLLMRQMARIKAECKKEKRKFSYRLLKKVYTIVLIEDSTALFWKQSTEYIHRGKQTFNTGLEIDMLQEYILIPLDVFREMKHNNLSKLEAWLYFIASDRPEDICRVIDVYPEFEELYRELALLRNNVEELVGMYDYYRELLREADRGTVEYMIEEQKRELEELEQKKEALAQENELLAQEKESLAQEKESLAQEKESLAQEKESLAQEKESLAQENDALAQGNKALAEEIERLKALLAAKE